MPPSTGLLLVGHGSRTAAGRTEVQALGDLVARSYPGPVETGFLELTDPPAGVALQRLVDTGVGAVTVVPLMLNPAGHAKSDVPAVVLDARARHAGVTFHYARPLGADHVTLGVAHRRLKDGGAAGLPLLVVARGTSEPEANADAYRVARLLAEGIGAPFVVTAFSGLTWPAVPDALEQCARLGADRLAVIAWYLSTGVLVERAQRDVATWSARTGIPTTDVGHLGPDPALVQLILDRADEAARGAVRMSCDVCTYRAPFPGFEDRVGQPVGIGHSHLASEHRGHLHRH